MVNIFYLRRDAVIGNAARHEVAKDGGSVRGVQDQVRELPQQVVECLPDVTLADHLLVQLADHLAGHLPVAGFVVHGQLDGEVGDHPPPGANVK